MAHKELDSPLSPSLIFDVCDNVFFPEHRRGSEVSSSSGGGSGCCYEDNSYTDLCFSSIPSDVGIADFADPSSTTNATTSVLSALLDSNPDGDTDDPTSLNFPPAFSIQSQAAPNQQDQLNSSLQSQIQLPDLANIGGFSAYSPESIAALPPPPQVLPPVFKEESLCPTQSYLCVDPTSQSSCSLLDHTGMGSFYGGNLNTGMMAVAADASAVFSSQEWEFRGINGSVYGSESVYSSGEFQVWCNSSALCSPLALFSTVSFSSLAHALAQIKEFPATDSWLAPKAWPCSSNVSKVLNENHQQQQQQLGYSSSYSSTVQHTTEMSSLDESSLKVGRLSAEERKEKIHRYLKKRNERNFAKKIKNSPMGSSRFIHLDISERAKPHRGHIFIDPSVSYSYACRKTLADSRPRVRGRFAKNDELAEAARSSFMHQEDEDEEVRMKDEEEMLDSSDIFAHISGVNSFRFSYPIQPWI
ncbi:hypothetical protein ACLOJK_007827 [Asimina triloba]